MNEILELEVAKGTHSTGTRPSIRQPLGLPPDYRCVKRGGGGGAGGGGGGGASAICNLQSAI